MLPAKRRPFNVELLQDKGKTAWEFEVVTDDGRTLAVDVDADTGDVIESEPKNSNAARSTTVLVARGVLYMCSSQARRSSSRFHDGRLAWRE
jgi:hypothetical protein